MIVIKVLIERTNLMQKIESLLHFCVFRCMDKTLGEHWVKVQGRCLVGQFD